MCLTVVLPYKNYATDLRHFRLGATTYIGIRTGAINLCRATHQNKLMTILYNYISWLKTSNIKLPPTAYIGMRTGAINVRRAAHQLF